MRNSTNSETENVDRIKRAKKALRRYVASKGDKFENSLPEIADLIADLLHLARETAKHTATNKADFQGEAYVIDLAKLHFRTESND